jgi:hypothetical protein
MTNQEIFDIVVAHARKQNRRALDGNSCRYRTREGLKCFAGALITDEHYLPELEGRSAYNIGVEQALTRSGVSETQLSLVGELQTIHDSLEPKFWEQRFEVAARKWKVRYRENNPT